LPNHASALKRARQNITRRKRNMANKTMVKSVIKDVKTLITEKKAMPEIQEAFKTAVSIIQKNACKGTIHHKKAARKVSRLSRQVNRIALA
jgi:small subunit ribosomal protein S20